MGIAVTCEKVEYRSGWYRGFNQGGAKLEAQELSKNKKNGKVYIIYCPDDNLTKAEVREIYKNGKKIYPSAEEVLKREKKRLISCRQEEEKGPSHSELIKHIKSRSI